MTQTEWLDHWQDRLVGMALTGLVLDNDERTKGPGTAGQAAMKLPEKVRTLLTQMYGTAQPDKPLSPPPAGANGSPNAGNGESNGRQQGNSTSGQPARDAGGAKDTPASRR